MSDVRERLARYREDPSAEEIDVSREELAAVDPEELPVGRAVRVEVLHPAPGGPLVTRELSRREDGRLVLMVDVYARRRYWRAGLPLRAYFRGLLGAVRDRAGRARDVLLLASRAERTRRQAHLAYLILSPGGGSVAEQYDAMAAVDEELRARAAAPEEGP